MRALLDVNVLIALLDPNHERHEIARRWLEENIQHGWASCAITQNGCLRIMSQPAYPHTLPVALVADLLQEATDTRTTSSGRREPDDARRHRLATTFGVRSRSRICTCWPWPPRTKGVSSRSTNG